MSRGLLDLIFLSVRGRLLRRARLLRQPRYLIAFLAGLAYFALVLIPRLFAGSSHLRPSVAGEYDNAFHLGLGLILALVVTGTWILASSRPALRLNETEIDFLLPAPVSRRQIILYSLLRQQPGIVTSVLVIYLVRGAGWAGSGTLAGACGLWAMLTLADLHLKGISLWKARLKELPPAVAWLRRAAAVCLAAAWWLAVLSGLQAAWKAAGPFTGSAPGAFALALTREVESGLAGKLLAPFAWLTRPVSGTAGALLPSATGFALLLAVVALHTVWVVSSRASFEEATLERARRESARKGLSRQALRARSQASASRHREPFRLAPAGRPEVAILWKNLMLRGRMPLSRVAVFLAAALVAASAAVAYFGPAVSAVLSMAGMALLAGVPLLAGMILRNDLRNDLLHVEVLRTWPLAGRRLFLAEILAPAVNVFFVLLIGCVLLLSVAAGNAWGGGADRLPALPRAVFAGVHPTLALPVVLASAVLAGMAVAFLSLALQNLAVLVLPSWIGLGGRSSRRGTAVLGQRVLVMIAYLLAMTVAALPTLLVLAAAVAAHVFLDAPLHLWEIPLFALVTAALLGSKVLLIARVGGMVWDRLDPSKEILALAEND